MGRWLKFAGLGWAWVALPVVPLPAQGPHSPWAIVIQASRATFHGAARDTVTASGQEIRLQPQNRLAVDAWLVRRLDAWEVSLGAGYAGGHVKAESEAVAVEDKTLRATRLRAMLLLGRRVGRIGSGQLRVSAGPTLDHWTSTGAPAATVLGGQVQAGLEVPLGGMALEQRASIGWSGSPFNRSGLPAEIEPLGLRTIGFGVGIRFGL